MTASHAYGVEYFRRYLTPGKFTRRPHGDNAPLHTYWVRYLRRHLPRASLVVEAGCGVGFFGRRAGTEFSYVGFDLSGEALDIAREQNGVRRLVLASAQEVPIRDGVAQAVIAFDIVEHLPRPEQFLREAYRILSRGGLLVLTTPNLRSLGARTKKDLSSSPPAFRRDATHISLHEQEMWIRLLTEAGFVVVRHGTDTLWDIPYSRVIPLAMQKVLLLPLNAALTASFGLLRWSLGENCVIVVRK
jgi:SAM-dependent methyltransferase